MGAVFRIDGDKKLNYFTQEMTAAWVRAMGAEEETEVGKALSQRLLADVKGGNGAQKDGPRTHPTEEVTWH